MTYNPMTYTKKHMTYHHDIYKKANDSLIVCTVPTCTVYDTDVIECKNMEIINIIYRIILRLY